MSSLSSHERPPVRSCCGKLHRRCPGEKPAGPSRTAAARRAAAPALITGLAGLTVLSQIGYPLTSGTLRDRLTVATVLLWCAASLTHAALSRGGWFAAGVLATSAGVGFGSEALGVATGRAVRPLQLRGDARARACSGFR